VVLCTYRLLCQRPAVQFLMHPLPEGEYLLEARCQEHRAPMVNEDPTDFDETREISENEYVVAEVMGA
jgi:hypothetical protein